MKFAYLAFDSLGKATPGATEAATATEAREALRQKGLFVTEIREDVAGQGPIVPAEQITQTRIWGRGKRLNNLAAFTRQLHVLVASGTPLVQSLAALERQAKDQAWRKVVADVRSRVEEGSALSQ